MIQRIWQTGWYLVYETGNYIIAMLRKVVH